VANYTEVFVGIDVAKARNAIAIADGERGGEVRFLGEVPIKCVKASASGGRRGLFFCWAVLDHRSLIRPQIEHRDFAMRFISLQQRRCLRGVVEPVATSARNAARTSRQGS
jgi:hypothetical protein